MSHLLRRRRYGFVIGLVLLIGYESSALGQEATIRSTAVVDLSFDETEGPAEDRAASGTVKDTATPSNDPTRIASPFWNVRDGQAVRFDAAKTQFFQIAHSEDLNHSAGTTLSFYYLNLHELTDATFHGIVAKRNERNTNYGLNYQPSSGKLQVYVHDGTGYKVVGFPIVEAFGVRRLVHLTATFNPGDAPAPDTDTDADDLEVRLYVNGKAIKPMDAPGGTIVAESGWIPDVNFTGRLNDAPLTIGSSFPNGEAFSGLVDEFLLFNRALSSEEVSKLFTEIAGTDGERLAKLETEAVPSASPMIVDLSPRAVQVGATTRLTITGRNLSPDASLSLLGAPATHSVLPESTAEKLVVEVTVPADASPTVVPLAVRTSNGISASIPLPMDRLPQHMLSSATNGQPVALPVALTGTLEGAQRHAIVIEGKAGQPIVAEVELKRLGGDADAVLELKTAEGTPIEVAWGRSQRGGDPRLVTKLPRDGRYLLELHDLAYKAPRSPLRLLVGDLRLIDAVVPSSAQVDGNQTATLIGIGVDERTVDVVTPSDGPLATLHGDAVAAAHNPLPAVPISDGRELTEDDVAAAPVDVSTADSRPTYVTGRLNASGEIDRIPLQVKSGQKIEVRVESKSLNSTVEPVIAAFEQDQQIGKQASQPGAGRAVLAFTPKSSNAELRISDRLAGEGNDRLYRVRIAPAGTSSLQVTGLDSSIVLPRSGRAFARFRVQKSGRVTAVRLVPDKASGVTIEPSLIPITKGNQEVFVTIAAIPGREVGDFLSVTAEADTPSGPLRRAVEMTQDSAVSRYDVSRPYFSVPIVLTSAAPVIELAHLPTAAFKGVTESIGLQVKGEIPEGFVARFSLVSDEPARPNDPKNPAAGTRPRVRILEDSTAPAGTVDAVVPFIVPADIAVAEVNAVVRVEVVPHAWSQHVAAVGYSPPFKLGVQSAIAAVEPAESAALKPGENDLKLLVQKQASFSQPVRIELRGLPEGFAAPGIDLSADQSEATFKLTVPGQVAAEPVANAELVVLNLKGALLFSKKPFPLEVTP